MRANGEFHDRARYEISEAVQIALLIGFTAQVRVTLLEGVIDGFVVALDVVILGVFIYCYADISPVRIVAIAAVFSPVFRTVFTAFEGKALEFSIAIAFPDAAFFIGYGIMYHLITSYMFDKPRQLQIFPYIAFLCDISGNIIELSVRSALEHHIAFSTYTVVVLFIIAFFRAVALMILILAIDTYSGNRISNVKREEYETLLSKFIVIQEEINLMDKNFNDVEDAMTDAYKLYQDLDNSDYPEQLSINALEIAKKTHEIKADYNNVITMLKGLFDEKQFTDSMTIQDIIGLEVRNAQEFAQQHGIKVTIRSDIRSGFEVRDAFKLMSIIRNLLNNAVESIEHSKGDTEGRIISLIVDSYLRDGKILHTLIVEDNGPGIPESRIESIFRAGFSTKFNTETGYIQRGLGLSIVKEYIERDFGGRISVESDPGRITRFTIELPDCQN